MKHGGILLSERSQTLKATYFLCPEKEKAIEMENKSVAARFGIVG